MKTKIEFNKNCFYNVNGIIVESKEEIDIIVSFFLKYGWLPQKVLNRNAYSYKKGKEILNELKTKKVKKIIKKPSYKLFVWKSVAKFRKRPKKIGGDAKVYMENKEIK